MKNIAVRNSRTRLSVESRRGRAQTKPRINFLGEIDGLITSETFPLVFFAIDSRASSQEGHFRLALMGYTSLRGKICHSNFWKVKILLCTAIISSELSFGGILLVIRAVNLRILFLAGDTISFLRWTFITPCTKFFIHFLLLGY